MKQRWKIFLAALLTLVMLLSLTPAALAAAEAATPGDLPWEWEEDESETPASDQPELLEIKVTDTVESGKAFTVTARLRNVKRTLLTVDGRVYPRMDTQGLTQEQLSEIMLGVSMTVPADGRVTITELADDLSAGKHVVGMLLLVDGEWKQSSRTATLTVTGSTAAIREPAGVTSDSAIEGGIFYLGKNEVGHYSTNYGVRRITVSSSTLARITLKTSTTFDITPLRTGNGTFTVYWTDGTRNTYKLYILASSTSAYAIELDDSGTVTVPMGSTRSLGYSQIPSTARESVSFRSSSTAIATVSSSGVVTPWKEGTAKITVTTAGGKSDYVYVKVTDPYKPTSVTVSQGRSQAMIIGETKTLTPVLTPSSARATYTWTSSNRNVATVDSNGKVSALKEGSATITLRTHNGKSCTVSVKVTDPYKPTSVKLSQGTTATVMVNKTLSLTPVLTPSSARATYTWSTSNQRVAVVSTSGNVTGVSEGTATITVRTHNGKSATIRVTVVDPHKPQSVEILANGGTVGTAMNWDRSKALTLSAKTVAYGGSGYTVPASYLTWTSSNTAVASIASNGVVTIKKAGTVTFTLKGKGGAKDTLKVTFSGNPTLTSMTISPTTVSLKTGYSQQMTVKLTPTTAVTNLYWWSSNSAIATVNQSGKITGVKAGTCVVYVQDLNTGIYRSVSVVVSETVHYRAILAVEKTYVETEGRRGIMTRQSDLDGMKKMLSQQNYGGAKWEISSYHTTSANTVLNAINAMAAKANSNDVTLFYFMGHGSSDGSIWFWDGTHITPATLKSYLDRVPGKVVVLLGSCYSGTYVTKGLNSSPADFTSNMIGAFAVGDVVPTTYVDENGTQQVVTGEMLSDTDVAKGVSHVAKRGELMSSKYYVLTCAAATEYGWSMFQYTRTGTSGLTINESKSWNVFTRGVTRAGGWDQLTSSTMWSSGTRTLSQVYSSVYSWCKSQSGSGTSSSVQVYPSGSSFILFQK